ncbi:MAG: bacteriohemerythrin [Candidatus Polarisedimenticolaceae bacterium]|nr:bacteriohemerythrin [Candidatus Polarisedimenticolaceae bacterium]
MNYWSWNSSLSVGIDVIDGQHRRIVDYINELNVAHLENDRDKVLEVLTGLVDYTLTHFIFEEELMEKAGYPLSDAHKKVHKTFVAHINKFVEQHNSGKDITRRLMSMLQVWLTNHIKNDDKDYVPLVKKSLNKKKGWISRIVGRLFG